VGNNLTGINVRERDKKAKSTQFNDSIYQRKVSPSRQLDVNNLPRVVTQQRPGRESNSRPLDRKSDALPLHHHATSGTRPGTEMFLNADGRLTETGQISRCPAGQTVADGGSGDREGPAADGRQFNGRYQQTIGPSSPGA